MSDDFWNKRVSWPVLDLPFTEGLPNLLKVKETNKWIRANSDFHKPKFVKMYHATDSSLDIESMGLLPTSTTRRRSYQSTSGYVYLASTPERAKQFGDLGNCGRSTVYEAIVLVKNLLADRDQLNNKRSVGCEIGNSIGESIVFGGGARVKGLIEPWAIRKLENLQLLVA